MKKAFLQLHIAVLLAGFTGVLGRLITLNEGLLVWYRLMISAISLWIIALLARQPIRIKAADLLRIFGIGAIPALHWVTFYGSIKAANVSIALVCFSSIGFFTALFEPMFFRVRINLRELVLSLIAVAGICFIFHFDPAFKKGIIIGLFSALLGSTFPILNKKLLRSIDAPVVTLYELSGGFLFLSLILPVYLKYAPAGHFIPTPQDLFWLLILALCCTVLAFNLSMRALKKISAFTVNLSYNLEPLYGIILAFLIYREDKSMNSGFYIGLFMIVVSVALQSWLVASSFSHQKKI
ncbi:MAG TPA: DMT family transporter [Puia sp.]|nr:DMT family transporter [Puia sp.]